MTAEQLQFVTGDGLTVPVYVARPAAAGRRPALILGYEAFGMQEIPEGGPYMRELAERFAKEGFVVAIPDYYAATGKQPVVSNGAISGSPSEEETRAILDATIEWLARQAFVDGEKIGTAGWCGGGRQVLLLAAYNPKIRAVASFYGRLHNRPGAAAAPSPIDLASKLACPVFGGYGEDDHNVTPDTVRQFKAALEAAGTTHEIHSYQKAGHAFMNDRLPAYAADATADVWGKLITFLKRHLS